jgi:hypothetical protein
VFSEDVGSYDPAWKNPSRIRGCKWDLLKIRRGNTKGAWWAQVESIGRENLFLFFRCFKNLH